MSIPHAAPQIRPAQPHESEALADIWYNGWLDAHADILPFDLRKYRTRESFSERMREGLPRTYVTGPIGAPLGLAMLKCDELDQLYVAAQARGHGVAAALIADAEARIAATGATTAWLACAIGNNRAARFYEKSGWTRARTFTSQLTTLDGHFALDVWRYEKLLKP